jgi:hypothetical protein
MSSILDAILYMKPSASHFDIFGLRTKTPFCKTLLSLYIYMRLLLVVGIGVDPSFTRREHQQALATTPFSNTYEADVVSPEAVMRGVQDRDVYN